MFEKAARMKLRFNTPVGRLSVEDLFDLTPKQLDNIYRSLSKIKADTSGDGLIDTGATDTTIQLSLDIVRKVFEIKKAEQDAAVAQREKRSRNQRIMQIINEKQDAALGAKSIEELTALLEQ